MRRSTDFAGWQSEIEYLADEAERQKKAEASVALYQRETKRPGMFISGWKLLRFFGEVLLGVALLGGLLFFGWRVIEALPRFIEAWR